MIESPVLDAVKEILRQRYEAEFTAKGKAEGKAEGMAQGKVEGLRNAVLSALERGFGSVPADRIAPLRELRTKLD